MRYGLDLLLQKHILSAHPQKLRSAVENSISKQRKYFCISIEEKKKTATND
jgi:hypothetical protein